MGGDMIVRRARGPWLYGLDRRRVLDFSLDSGRLPFGHAPLFLREPLRRVLARGERRGCGQPELSGLLASLMRYLPGYHVSPVVSPEAVRECLPASCITVVPEYLVARDDRAALKSAVSEASGPLLFDESASAFCQIPDLFALEYQPEAVLVNGALGCCFLAWRTDSMGAVPAYMPGSHEVQRAAAVFSRVRKQRDAFDTMRALIDRFVSRLCRPPSGWQGIFPILAIDGEVRAAAEAAGFLLAGDCVVRVSTAHEPAMVDRLAVFLNSLGGA